MEKVNFWEDKNVLVTGADGFIGGWIAKGLVEKGANVATIMRDVRKKNNIEVLGIKNKINIIYGDLINFSDCERAINEYEIECCFHIAAQAIVRIANNSPLSTFESNIRGTWNIMEACRLSKSVKGVVVATSDKAYGQQKVLPYTEDSPLLGYYPYDASKACADIITTYYFKTYNVPVAVTRNANTYGMADMNFSRLVPEVILSLLKGKEPVIRSDGTPERDYMFIRDAVNAYLALGENLHRKDVAGQAFNFGTGVPISVLELYNKITSIMGKSVKPKILNQAENEIDKQYLSIEKVKKVLGWQPKYSLDEGLKETIEWYKNYFNQL